MIQTLCSRLVLSLLAFPLKLANARLVEGYIDDTFGDALTGFKPRYYPPIPGLWQNASCTDCIIKPDSSRTNNGSWTSGGYSPSKTGPLTIELEFSGTFLPILRARFATSRFDRSGVFCLLCACEYRTRG